MTAKEYLMQIQRMKQTADSLGEKAEALRAEMEGLKAITYDKDRVQVSPSNRMEELMPKLIEAEEKYGEALFNYYKEILLRTKQIDEIGRNDFAEILRLRYVELGKHGRRLTLEEIAVKTHRSFEWVRHLHGRALKAFEKKYL